MNRLQILPEGTVLDGEIIPAKEEGPSFQFATDENRQKEYF